MHFSGILKSILLLLVLSISANAGTIRGTQAPTYTGNGATRVSTGVWGAVLAGPMFFQTRSYHFVPNGLINSQILLPGWRGNGNSDPAIGLNLPIGAEIEVLSSPTGSPGTGSCTTLTFGGSTSGTLVSGSELISDVGPSISPNRGVYIYLNWGSATGSVPYGGISINTLAGDAMDSSTSAVVHTPCGAVSNTVAGAGVLTVPAMLLGLTAYPSLCGIGDSILNGSSDTATANALIGFFQRVIGARLPFVNMAISGTSAKQFSASTAAKRTAWAKLYCTHIFSNLGINSFLVDNVATATAQADLTNTMAAFSGGKIKGFWQTTLMPWVNDAANTTPGSSGITTCTDRTSYNTWIKTLPTGMTGFFDVASVTESQVTPCLWANTGYLFNSNPWVHPNATGTTAVLNSNIIPLSTFFANWP